MSRLYSSLVGWFRDNFVLLALMVAAIWLIVLWGWFRESEKFAAYATFGVALVTLCLASATALMARETTRSRKLTEELVRQNRQLHERPHALELLVNVVVPLLESATNRVSMHKRRAYHWKSWSGKPGFIAEEDLHLFQPFSDATSFYCPDPDLELHWREGGIFDDLKIMFPELVNKIMFYNDLEIQRGFKGLLVSLARDVLLSPKFREEVNDSRSLYCADIACSSLLVSEKDFSDYLRGIVVPEADGQKRLQQAKELWEEKGSILKDNLKNNDLISSKLEKISEESKGMVAELEHITGELSKFKHRLMSEHGIYFSDIEQKQREMRRNYLI
jgi:hypothetical protein